MMLHLNVIICMYTERFLERNSNKINVFIVENPCQKRLMLITFFRGNWYGKIGYGTLYYRVKVAIRRKVTKYLVGD